MNILNKDQNGGYEGMGSLIKIIPKGTPRTRGLLISPLEVPKDEGGRELRVIL
jgi:hypothetical protein